MKIVEYDRLARLPCQSVVFHNLHSTNLKRRSLNEEVPIYICSPCHGAQPVRGVGARSAKAATATLTATPASGVFASGADLVPATMTIPAVAATSTFTLGGSPAVGDVVTINWLDTLGAVHTVSYTVTLADTMSVSPTALTIVATQLPALVTGTATATAVTVSGIPTVTLKQN